MLGYHNQLCWLRTEVNRWRMIHSFARQVGLNVFPIVVVRQFVEAVWQFASEGTRPLQISSSQPGSVVAKVVKTGRTVLEQIPVGVDTELQLVFLDRTPDRVSIKTQEYRWCPAEEYCYAAFCDQVLSLLRGEAFCGKCRVRNWRESLHFKAISTEQLIKPLLNRAMEIDRLVSRESVYKGQMERLCNRRTACH